MSRFLRVLVFATLAASPINAQQQTTTDLVIRGVSVVDVERGRVDAGRTVVIRGNRIVAVQPAGQAVPAGARLLDGTGKYLIPGLWDMHAHLSLSGNPLRVELPLFVANGVTGVRVMSADRPNADTTLTPGLDQHRQAQAGIAAGQVTGPRLMALASWAVNGPASIPAEMPAFYGARTAEDGARLARHFQARGFDFVKIYNAIPREGYFGLAAEARRLGLPFAGHEPQGLSAIEISNAGQASLEHSRIFLFNCFPGADSLRRGLLGDLSGTARRRRMVDEYDPAICAEVFRTFARNGTWITPTHGTRRMDAMADDSAYRADPRMAYIPLPQQLRWRTDADGMVAGDPSPEGRRSYLDFYRKGLELTRDAYRAGVPVMVGTDAGDSFVFPGSTVHDEMAELVRAGLTPAEALRAATLAGATFLGVTADHGTVQPGRMADLVLLDGNPLDAIANTRRIDAVIFDGRVLDRAALDALLDRVASYARPTAQQRLWAAAIDGDTVTIAGALAAGAVVDSLDPEANRRPLNYAAFYNRVPAVRLLLARGAPIDRPNRTGFTPLHHAVENRSHDALRFLIDAGADLTLRTGQGMMAVELARTIGDTVAVRMLEAVRP
ncbi:MAG: amidohydrolase family protein [Gemmatimonadales bacterium]|nr:amidohydrolase family protein [Gemmatimonadales bacterium]